MKKLHLLFLLITCSANIALAQFPPILWKKCLGGGNDERAYTMRPTFDSGFILAGSSRSDDTNVTGNHGGLDYWIVKVSDTGGIQWKRCLGGSGDEEPTSIVPTRDSGYIVAGYSTSADGQVSGHHGAAGTADYWIVKLNYTGDIVWQRSYGGAATDMPLSIRPTKDDGYIVAGYSNSTSGDVTGSHGNYDYWVLKISDSGAIQWQRSLGGINDDLGYSVLQTDDEGYIVLGYTGSNNGDVSGNHGDGDYWLAKLDASGTLQWQKAYGGSNMDEGICVQPTYDGGYIMAGNSYSDDGDITGHHTSSTFHRDIWVVKTDDTGGVQWEKSLGGTGAEELNAIAQNGDGDYLVAGTTQSVDGDVAGHIGNFDSWIVQLTPGGDVVSQKCLGGSGYDAAVAIYPAADQGLVILSATNSTDGEVAGNHGGYDYWLVKLGYPHTTSAPPAATQQHIGITPNPTTASFTITGINTSCIKIYDALGNLATETINSNTIKADNLSAGVYIMVLLDADGSVVFRSKVVKL